MQNTGKQTEFSGDAVSASTTNQQTIGSPAIADNLGTIYVAYRNF